MYMRFIWNVISIIFVDFDVREIGIIVKLVNMYMGYVMILGVLLVILLWLEVL